LGKQENCRVAVSVSLATEQASLPVTYGLYLPEVWAQTQNGGRRRGYRKKSAFRPARDGPGSNPPTGRRTGAAGPVLADAAYGNDNGFRDGLEKLLLQYVVGVQSTTTVWRRVWRPFHPRPAELPDGRPNGCNATKSIGPFRSRNWPGV